MFFKDPKMPRRQPEPKDVDGNELAIARFLATSRRYFDLAPTHAVGRPLGTAEATPPARGTPGRRARARPRGRTIASSLLLATTFGLGGPLSAYAVVDDGASGSVGKRTGSRLEEHRQKLRDALGLTPAQEAAWEKLVAAEQGLIEPAGAASEDWAALTTPERAARMLERLRAHRVRVGEHAAALRDFHTVLTPAQRQCFDAFHAAPQSMLAASSAKVSDTVTG
jgi:hypothetical protein